MFRAVEDLLRPKTIAIIGASDSSRGGWAQQIYDNLAHCDFPAKLYLVNPKRRELWGRPVYPDFAAIPERVDLALTIIPTPGIPATLAEAAASGLKCALIYAAEFGEGGNPEGEARAQAVRDLCARTGMRVSGPNCMGVIALREKLLLYPAKRVRALLPGSVGVVFQSGGTFQYWLQQGSIRGLGFSYAISSGNELDLDLADYINFMVDDAHTKMIACMVEGIHRPAAFMAAAEKALAAGKPILMVKVGRSERGRAAVKSHTGAIAGDDQVFDAVCRKYGVVRCVSLDDMLETALAFSTGRLPQGKRIAMVCASGGGKGLFLDYSSDEGAEMAVLSAATQKLLRPLIDSGVPAENPLDCGATVATLPRKFGEICKIVLADPNIDLAAVQGALPVNQGEPGDPVPFAEMMASTEIPVIAYGRMKQNISEISRKFQSDTGMPFLQGVPDTVRALQSLVHYSAALRRGIAALPAPRGRLENLAAESFPALLEAQGVTPPRSATCRTAEEAARRAAEIGFPVALKILSPAASHKTELGGVALHLADQAAVIEAASTMTARLAAFDKHASLDGFLVQEMVEGVEIIVGLREDPLYGPFMVVGLGGVLVEVLRDVAIRLLPVDEAGARDMLASLKGAALLGDFRGRKARDVTAAVKAMVGLSQIFVDHRAWLSDLEINPLILAEAGQGVRAVDIRMVRRTG